MITSPLKILGGILGLILFSSALGAQDAYPGEPILPNADMETDEDGDGWPDGWPKLKSGGSWEEEDGNRFIRLKSTEPGATTMIYREISIPEGVEAIEMTWKQRVTGLKRGKNSWFDARIMMEFMDADRKKVSPGPKAPNTSKDTDGWVEKQTAFLVPEGAEFLKFMPALLQVETGTMDLDDMILRPTDPVPLRQAAEEAAAKRAEALAKKETSMREKAAAKLEEHGNLIAGGDFEEGSKIKGNILEEDGNRFLRLQSTEPDQMTMAYWTYDIPEGVKALELSWKQRITDFKKGADVWHDARIMMEYKNAAGKKVSPGPSPAYSRSDTDGWDEKSKAFLVPEEAVTLVLMPALAHVKSGTFDLDDLRLKPADAEPLIAKAKEAARQKAAHTVPPEEPNKAKWPPELKVAGNRLHDPEGNEVWLQGVHVVSLEWNPRGESVLKSILVAIDDWGANVIRLSVKEEYWFDEKGGEDYKELIDQAVNLTANRGAYLVIDNHRYRAVRKEHIPFWEEVATKYKNHPAVLFDIINEPHGISWEVWRNGGFVEERSTKADEDAFLEDEELKKSKQGFESPGMQAMVDAIRATGAKNIVIAGGLDWAYDLSGILNGYALEDKTGNGIMYSSHIYPWKSGWQEKMLDVATLHPIFIGEVGADANKMEWMPADQQEDAETWVPDMIGLIQKHRLNWTAFSFHPKASPRMLLDWDYTPTPFWGEPVKRALAGEKFELKKLR